MEQVHSGLEICDHSDEALAGAMARKLHSLILQICDRTKELIALSHGKRPWHTTDPRELESDILERCAILAGYKKSLSFCSPEVRMQTYRILGRLSAEVWKRPEYQSNTDIPYNEQQVAILKSLENHSPSEIAFILSLGKMNGLDPSALEKVVLHASMPRN